MRASLLLALQVSWLKNQTGVQMPAFTVVLGGWI